MKLALIAVVSCLALSVKSASFVTSLGIPSGQSTTNALLPYYMYKNMPVIDVQSFDLVCRTPDMDTPVRSAFSITAGSTIRVNWDTKTASPYSTIMPYGPCSYWLAPYASKGKGKVWSKIHENTYKGDDTKADWCTVTIQEKGYYDVKIPEGLAPGKYYLRSEVIDLDGARGNTPYQDFTAGARFHVNCAVLDITGTGTALLKSPISIMEAYKPYYKTTFFPTTMKNSQFKMPGGKSPYADDTA
ncbi:hypothetical protein IWW37_000776 [Coemansia sp. RSA 2050]|nr:hypothetical protein IWW37_000776 [Coemansia sp. RSA 2050]KAJ2732281.1 hypothetical protein IW152_003905 [Coemansia sp. BCRC 34962]